MTEAVFGKWYKDAAVMCYVWSQARRHANNDDDMMDFEQEAWARVSQLPDDAKVPRILGEIYRGIHAAYERELRHRKHEIPFSRYEGNVDMASQ